MFRETRLVNLLVVRIRNRSRLSAIRFSAVVIALESRFSVVHDAHMHLLLVVQVHWKLQPLRLVVQIGRRRFIAYNRYVTSRESNYFSIDINEPCYSYVASPFQGVFFSSKHHRLVDLVFLIRPYNQEKKQQCCIHTQDCRRSVRNLFIFLFVQFFFFSAYSSRTYLYVFICKISYGYVLLQYVDTAYEINQSCIISVNLKSLFLRSRKFCSMIHEMCSLLMNFTVVPSSFVRELIYFKSIYQNGKKIV